jgi:hypothetical protein
MTADEIKQRFPRASAAFIRANLSAGDTGEASVVECNPGDAPLEAQEVQGSTGGRFLVRVTCRRKKPLDQSNRCYKFHEDLLRYAGIIPDDTSELVDSESPQTKCKKGEPEEITVEVFVI